MPRMQGRDTLATLKPWEVASLWHSLVSPAASALARSRGPRKGLSDQRTVCLALRDALGFALPG